MGWGTFPCARCPGQSDGCARSGRYPLCWRGQGTGTPTERTAWSWSTHCRPPPSWTGTVWRNLNVRGKARWYGFGYMLDVDAGCSWEVLRCGNSGYYVCRGYFNLWAKSHKCGLVDINYCTTSVGKHTYLVCMIMTKVIIVISLPYHFLMYIIAGLVEVLVLNYL